MKQFILALLLPILRSLFGDWLESGNDPRKVEIYGTSAQRMENLQDQLNLERRATRARMRTEEEKTSDAS